MPDRQADALLVVVREGDLAVAGGVCGVGGDRYGGSLVRQLLDGDPLTIRLGSDYASLDRGIYADVDTDGAVTLGRHMQEGEVNAHHGICPRVAVDVD